MKVDRYAVPLVSAAAFLVPGLALWLPSGYSIGAAMLLLGALVLLPLGDRRIRPLEGAGWLALSIVAMAFFWLLDSRSGRTDWGGFDRPTKYMIALPCLLLVHVYAPRVRPFFWGIAIGAIGSGGIALYQRAVQHLPRAMGYTNAIQFGDLALLLGLMCLTLFAVRPPGFARHWQRAVLLLGALLGGLASVLSETRGGWLALAVVLPVLVVLLWCHLPHKQMLRVLAAAVLGIGLLGLTQPHMIDHRLEKARTELQQYEKGDQEVTSVGQRLSHWKLAWQMGWDRPLTGWTQNGYEVEKARRVHAGLAHPSVLSFSHAHNEVLDIFAKRGLPGVAALLFFYAVPLWLFWPRRRLRNCPDPDPTALALRVVGVLVPVCCIAFGLTQVFMAHNSGNMCYLFFNLLVYGCLRGHEARTAAALPATGATADACPARQ